MAPVGPRCPVNHYVEPENNEWNNGFYTSCKIGDVKVDLLVDSGSSCTLLSNKIYQSLDSASKDTLCHENIAMKDVKGSNINVQGTANVVFKLGNFEYRHPVIVCDILPDGILGQDFMLKHVKSVDYENYMLHTANDQINCWIGKKTSMVCRVLVESTVKIPPMSSMWVPVKIPSQEHLDSVALVEPVALNNGTQLVSGVIETENTENVKLHVVNCTEENVTLFPKTVLGSCMSVKENTKENIAEQIHSCNNVETNVTDSLKSDVLPDYLEDLYKRSSTHINDSEKQALKRLLIEYQDVFAKDSCDLGLTDILEHKIPVKEGVEPIRQQVRRIPQIKKDIERVEIQKMLQNGIIEPSVSPWLSNLVIVNKKDGTHRICVDYRKVNEVLKKDSYPLPRLDECLDALAGNTYYSSMDLCSGYWQIPIEPESREVSAFATSMGLFQFVRMPFGMSVGPATFCRLIGEVLRGLQWIECVAYMDDITVPSETVSEGLTRLEHVFQRLRMAKLKLKPSKCLFLQTSIHFLGHLASKDGIHTDPAKVEAVTKWPVPCSVKQVRSFLGLAAYYKRFIEGFSQICKPLYQLCEKNRRFKWTEQCQLAFDNIKEKLSSAPVLAYPETGKDYILDTDASQYCLGGVLSQCHDGQERVIAYMSKTMNKHELSYCTTRKELLAVVTALKHWKHYVLGHKITLRTDNAAVSWMRNLKNPTGQVARWLEHIECFDLDVKHRPGRLHSNSDALSRIPCKACARQENNTDDHECMTEQTIQICKPEPNTDNDTVNVCTVTTRGQFQQSVQQQIRVPHAMLESWDPVSVRQEQVLDPSIGLIVNALESSQKPSWEDISPTSSTCKTLWRQWDRLTIIAGMLYRKFYTDADNAVLQLVVPLSLRATVLKNYHDIPSAAHLGSDKTLEKVKSQFYWPSMKDDIKNYCAKCDVCASRKLPTPVRAPLGQNPVYQPMERICIDLTGPLPETENKNRYIMVVTDWFTKWTEAYPIPDQSANTVAKTLVENFIVRFGCPLSILTDQGTCFESGLFQEVCQLLGITKLRTSVMRPQANAVVERFNRTLKNMLSAYCSEKQKTWDLYLPHVMMAYRASTHASTKFTPNKMVFGRDILLPMAAVIGQPEQESTDDTSEYVRCLKETLKTVHEMASDNLKLSATYRKKHYDIKSKSRTFERGQAVWLYQPTRKPGVCSKLIPKWKGPFLVTKRIDDLTYLVQKSQSQKSKAYHIDHLMEYRGNNKPKWFKSALQRNL